MHIINTDTMKYLGYYDGRHHFQDILKDSILSCRECKVWDNDSRCTFYCKRDGSIEASYGTLKKVPSYGIKTVKEKIFSFN